MVRKLFDTAVNAINQDIHEEQQALTLVNLCLQYIRCNARSEEHISSMVELLSRQASWLWNREISHPVAAQFVMILVQINHNLQIPRLSERAIDAICETLERTLFKNHRLLTKPTEEEGQLAM